MAITGNLRTMQLSELLQWLSMGQKTGTLVVKSTSGEKRIYFKNGRIISSSSTLEREYLGHFLVAYGYITEEELEKAMQVQQESKILLGKILVMIGAIQEAALADLIRLKASETIYDIFLWTEGGFEFIDGEIPQLPMIPISADVTGIVMEGLRRYDEWQRIRTKIQNGRAIPGMVQPIDLETLPDRERLILHAIDGIHSIEEIALSTFNPEFSVARFVFDLMESGHAAIVGEKPEDLPPAEDADEAVFAEANDSPFSEDGDHEKGVTIEPEPRAPAPTRDFSRFLKRGPDSSAGASRSTLPPLVPPPAPVPADASDHSRPALKIPSSVEPPRPPAGSDSYPNIPLTPSTALIPANAVPTLTKPMEELMSWSFTPNEAFIVSRINGHWDVKSIVKISPFPEIEVLRVFQRLHTGGVIAWH
ncbi:MAG: DUF4388 domain-containing protein [Thermoanaerobaculia bacterium]